jgi:Tfp pilus assembly protein PilN
MLKKRINLLPPEEQRQNRLLEINYQVVRLGFTVTATILVLGLSLFGSSLYFETVLHETEAAIEANRQTLAKFQRTGIEGQILELNQAVANFNALSAAPTKWSQYLIELARLLPREVSLDTLKIDAATGRVDAAGLAQTRNSVLALRKNILGSSYFANINFPLANLEASTNVAWKYRFYLKPYEP